MNYETRAVQSGEEEEEDMWLKTFAFVGGQELHSHCIRTKPLVSVACRDMAAARIPTNWVNDKRMENASLMAFARSIETSA